MADIWFYLGASASSALYALALEKSKKRLEPDFTWLEVMIGVVLTGIWVALRMRFGVIPSLPPIDLVWWVCWQWVWMFCATGLSIIIWQIWQMRRRLLETIRFAREEE